MNSVSQLGFGIMRLPNDNGNINLDKVQEIIDEYMEGDFCYFDLHPGYMFNRSQDILRECVVNKYPRDSFLVANKMPYYGLNETSDYEKTLLYELRACGVTYFDYYMLHAVTREVYEQHEKLGGFDFLRMIKQDGRARKVGISFHDKPDLLEEILEKHSEIDFVVLQINYYDWESPIICSRTNYEIAKRYAKQIIVMEPIKGGSLANTIIIDEEEMSPERLAKISLQFVASLSGIDIILSGMSDVSHVRQNRKTISEVVYIKPESEIYSKLKKEIQKKEIIPCTGCGYCIRECPKNINIKDIIATINTYKIGCGEKGVGAGGSMSTYAGVVYNRGKASDCIDCGKCERKCPQKLEIRKYMREAVEMFEPPTSDKESIKEIPLPKKFHNITELQEVVLWGAGNCFKTDLRGVLSQCDVHYVCDNNMDLWGKEVFPGIMCLSPDELKEMKNVFVVVMVKDENVGIEIEKQLEKSGINNYDLYHNWLGYARQISYK